MCLGIYLDKKLNFEMQESKIKNKLHSSIFMLRVLSEFCENKTLLIAYHALFESHLNYCINTWSNTSEKRLDEILILQKRAIRTMFRLKKDESCREFFKQFQMLTLPGIIVFNSMKHMYSV